MGVGVRSGYLGQFPNFVLVVKRKNGLCGSGLLNQCWTDAWLGSCPTP